MAIEMKKTKVKMNKPVYLGMSILDISKMLMYKFWYNFINPKYGDRAKLCYTDTDSFIIHIITENFFEDIAGDIKKWFDTSSHDENDKRPFPIGMDKRVYGFFKNELGGKIMKEFVALKAKTYAYLTVDDDANKKAKGTNKCVIKHKFLFENYKYCLLNGKAILKSQQRFKSDHHKLYREEVNKIELSCDDDKRLQTFNRVTTYPYVKRAVKVCENEMMVVRDLLVKKYVDCPFYGEIVLNNKDKCFQRINDQF